MLKKTLLAIFVLFICFKGHAQFLKVFHNRYPWQGYSGIKRNLVFTSSVGVEVGYYRSDLPFSLFSDTLDKMAHSGGLEYLFNQNVFICAKYLNPKEYGAKMGYELNFLLLCFKTSYECLYNERARRLTHYFVPEIGLTTGGFVTLTYAYRVGNGFNSILSRGQINAGINLGFGDLKRKNKSSKK
jgi:hypothetical protein